MQITILNKQQEWPICDTNTNIPNFMILGVHSFTHTLLKFTDCKKINILFQGKIQSLIDNILWNQFFSATFLADCYRFLGFNGQQDNTFFKINGRTFKLREIADWHNKDKVGQLLRKCYTFMIQGFMRDGSMRIINVDIGNKSMLLSYDLLFTYSPSIQATKKSRRQSTTRKNNKKFENQSGGVTRSIAIEQQRYGGIIDNKYQSEKKNVAKATWKADKVIQSTSNVGGNKLRNSIKFKGQNLKNDFAKSTKKNEINNRISKKNQRLISFDSEEDSFCNFRTPGDLQRQWSKSRKDNGEIKKSTQKLGHKNSNFSSKATISKGMDSLNTNGYNKEKIIENMLFNKDSELRKCKKLLQEKQQEYFQSLQSVQKQHETEVASIKEQVNQILETYKKKNRELRKQNQCLNEANSRLGAINDSLQHKFNEVSQELNQNKQKLSIIVTEQQSFQSEIQKLKAINKKLLQQNQEKDKKYAKAVAIKDSNIEQARKKYNNLIKNIQKIAIATTDEQQKQNTSHEQQIIFKEKQNII